MENQALPKMITWIVLLSALLLVAACVAPPAEVVDEADMSAEEAAALAEGETAAEDAADEAEKAAEDAADEAEKAVEEAADALEASLRNFEELDADASEADVDQAFAEFNAASEEMVAVAAAEGADADAVELALDELEQQIRSSLESGEPLEFQKDFLSDFYSDFFN
jgi:hypothetical protein